MVKHRTEVVAGGGLVLRYGELSAWIGPSASAAFVAYLVGHARDLAHSSFPAPELANRLESVLQGVDPEPATPFIIVGAASGGLEALLHGPVQLWDAVQWVVLPPGTGWMRWSFAGEGPVVAGPAGSLPPQLMVDSPVDLTTGVVPGGGLALLPLPAREEPAPAPGQQAQSGPGSGSVSGMAAEATIGVAAGGPAAGGSVAAGGPAAGGPAAGGPAAGGSVAAGGPLVSGAVAPGGAVGPAGGMPGGGLSGRPSAATIVVPPPGSPGLGGGPPAPPRGGPSPQEPAGRAPADPGLAPASRPERDDRPPAPVGPLPGAEPPRPPGGLREREIDPPQAGEEAQGMASVNLREPYHEHREPLPLASAQVEAAGGVEVQGIRCSRGHFNHPRALYCTACGIATTHQTHVLTRGPRPPLGVLVLDDGSTYSLDSGYVIGSAPEGDEAVIRGEERPLRLPAPEDQVSAVHAELRLVDWDVQLIDRGSVSGTFVLPPGAQTWQPLQVGSPVVVVPNSHIACGRRVFAFESHLRN